MYIIRKYLYIQKYKYVLVYNAKLCRASKNLIHI